MKKRIWILHTVGDHQKLLSIIEHYDEMCRVQLFNAENSVAVAKAIGQFMVEKENEPYEMLPYLLASEIYPISEEDWEKGRTLSFRVKHQEEMDGGRTHEIIVSLDLREYKMYVHHVISRSNDECFIELDMSDDDTDRLVLRSI